MRSHTRSNASNGKAEAGNDVWAATIPQSFANRVSNEKPLSAGMSVVVLIVLENIIGLLSLSITGRTMGALPLE